MIKIGALSSFILLLLLWEAISLPGLLPSPLSTLRYIASLDPDLIALHTVITLYNSFAGFSLSMLLSLALGFLSHRNEFIRGFSMGICSIFNSTSALIWSLVLVSTIGILSPLPPILVASAVSLPQLLSATIAALDSVDKNLIEAVRSLGGSSANEYLDVIIPGSLPMIIAASRVALGLSLRISVVAEAFGSSGGIGYMIMRSYNLADAPGVLAWSLILIALVLALDRLLLMPVEERSSSWLK
ncbi:ABC transporter permease subunit [Candidatus Korarchaeum cryptofilum]|uniref:ABC-type nitrate/sulfonate/bicarbonate transport system, periplasmic component n=2 Tax=Candidatus Korarchaeum cryptofilum TaxID=498846 RepID=B1L457_KORCO|nr:ABC transporter permease subunit [Candidatus Korarchaeum cryptofilum]ACB07236.1 ABC-type nitrate/sulfonate/bicarbonate transport system, periplasmic component [Candidatus Korarchaeum cryptofilum OPF8]RSN68004.1 ABC transporter permease subunit [Candidatus Korarchaeum cryptofilum]